MPEGALAPPTLVFDLDGTLVDTVEDLVAALNVIGAPEGLQHVPLADGRIMVGHGMRTLIERAFATHGRPLSPDDLDRLTAAFIAEYTARMPGQSRPYPHLDATLDRFAAAGWRMAVCTNKYEASARRLLSLLGLADRFAVIAGQDTLGFRKPDPRHVTETIRAAGGDLGHAVMVGDSLSDVDAAIAAGVPAVVVSFGYSAVPVAELGAARIIDDFSDLWAAVTALSKRPKRQPSGARR